MRTVWILCGPTAVGKSAVALHLARASGAEILSIDSMKLYRGLDIGTGKATPAERAQVRHHLIDIREPWEGYSVAQFLPQAEAIIEDCARRGVPLLGEGGTALYLKALAEGLFDGPGKDEGLRTALEAEAEAQGLPVLYERMTRLDPAAAQRIMPTDLRRIVRALEVHALTGKPISDWQQQWGVARTDMDVRLVCLRMPREILYPRIDRRIAQMLREGWLDECRRLLELGRPLSREATKALGYRNLFAHLRGEVTLAAAQERINFDTHHFARRQLLWFRKMPKLEYIDIDGSESIEAVAARVQAVLKS